MARILLFVLLPCLFIAPMDGRQDEAAMELTFGVHSAGFFLTQEECKGSKRRVFTSVEFGSRGEERIIVQSLEYDANFCRSAPRPGETVIDIDPPNFQTAPSTPYVGEGRDNSSQKVHGVDGGAGGYPGGGPDGGGGGEPDGNSDSDSAIKGRNRRSGERLNMEKIQAALKKLAKISVYISSQIGTTLLFVTGGTPKSMEYSIVAIIVCSYFFCLFSFVVRESKPVMGAIISAVGSLLAALGFLLTMCLIIPPEFIWVLVISAILLFSSLSVLSFC